VSASSSLSPLDGLTAAEVGERVRDGRTNAEGAPTSRSVGEILRANVLTFFNGLLAIMLVAILVFGQLRDALFGVVLFLNMAIGIIQELRAKRTLDRLSLLAAPRARVVREGEVVEVAVAEVATRSSSTAWCSPLPGWRSTSRCSRESPARP
jgi:cation-transporting ATPase E